MEYRKLGNTGLDVSVICLGSMTWGEQNTLEDACEQLDYALSQGINFIDTAELYSVPAKASTYGFTEQFIGEWLKKSGKRKEVILATKIAGPGEWISHIREGQTRFNDKHISTAVDASLKRLQTDYIDLYQLHWPERHTNFFGRLGYQAEKDENLTPFLETLNALDKQIQAGKIRHIGLSNETPWGFMKFLEIAEQHQLPRVASVQNPYSLLNRSYEIGMAEISHREKTGLLAYSPLGFGVLSGKYLGISQPSGSRLNLFPEFDRYSNQLATEAVKQYVTLARDHNLEPAQMALAYVNSRPFLTSTIIGATTMEQLRVNVKSININLSSELKQKIEAIHKSIPNPCP